MRPPAILLASLLACGPSKGTTTDDTDATDTTDTAAASTTIPTPPTTTGEPTSTSTTTGTSTADPNTCDIAPPEAAQTCAAQTDRARCNAATGDFAGGNCLWIPWFPVRLVEGTCTFGDPRGSCAFIECHSEGCTEILPCNGMFGSAFMKDAEGKVTIASADWCLAPPAPAQPCIFDTDQNLLEGPPECACLCDPAFPGA